MSRAHRQFPAAAHHDCIAACLALVRRRSRRCASSPDIIPRAPSRDKSVELFTRLSVPPAVTSKDNREWNYVLPPIVCGEHKDDFPLIGRRRAVPFRFRHPSPRRLKRFGAFTITAFRWRDHFARHKRREGPCGAGKPRSTKKLERAKTQTGFAQSAFLGLQSTARRCGRAQHWKAGAAKDFRT